MKEKTELCPCKDKKEHSFLGYCGVRISPDFETCYFCYMGHKIPDSDNDASMGDDEIGYQKGEDVDFQ